MPSPRKRKRVLPDDGPVSGFPLQTNASDSLGHVLVMADKCTVHAQYDQAITMLTDFYRKPSLDDHSKAMITYTLSEAYRLKGDKKGQKHFLALRPSPI